MYFCFLFLSAYVIHLVSGNGDCKENNYVVKVFTGKDPGAGTTANVKLVMQGEKGYCIQEKLGNVKSNFQQGKIDNFTLKCECLGRIKWIVMGHDNTGRSPGWYLEKVVVIDSTTKQKYVFNSGGWISNNAFPQGRRFVSVILDAEGSSNEKPLPDKPVVKKPKPDEPAVNIPLPDCFKEKCVKPGQMWTKTMDDKRVIFRCKRGNNGQLQAIIADAGLRISI